MLKFNNAFWEDIRNPTGSTYKSGPSALFSILEQGNVEISRIISFLKERIKIEQNYSDSLRKLSLQNIKSDPVFKDEGRSLKNAFDGMYIEMDALANSHSKIANDLQNEVVRILINFSSEHRLRINSEIENIESKLNSLEIKRKNFIKAEIDYKSKILYADKISRENSENLISINQPDSNDQKISPNPNNLDSPNRSPSIFDTQSIPSDSFVSNDFGFNSSKAVETIFDVDFGSIILGSLSLTDSEFLSVIKRLKAELRPHEVRYGILGSLKGLIKGEDLFKWWERYSSTTKKSSDDILAICQSMVDMDYLRYMGKGTLFSVGPQAYYQWKKKANDLILSNSQNNKNTTSIGTSVSMSRTQSSVSNSSDSSIFKINSLLGIQSSATKIEKAEKDAEQSLIAYKDSVISAESSRIELESDMVTLFLKISFYTFPSKSLLYSPFNPLSTPTKK
ncbi:Rho-GTPase-activating protein 8 [Smittium mucronatum]|uniref:Rho-GTPase-activating protein 8 n=1 Tax=Smittium mucronatum TaxID=133383 RepID=A0A1R0GWY6_9FUNG|nr:Rho-GTPase-activating protein 8 [Smittium mucronatum]